MSFKKRKETEPCVRSVGLYQAKSRFYISKKGRSLHSLLDELDACGIFYLVHVYLHNRPWAMLCL